MLLRSYFLRCFIFILFCLTGQAFAAKQPDTDQEHVQSAFLFADRKDWNDALLHAKESHNAVLHKLITWEYLLDTDSGASFDEITQFINENPDWPEQKRLRIRAELALRGDTVPDHDIIAWFGDDTPITGVGKIALAEALMRSKRSTTENTTSLIREAWIKGDFDETQEKQILNKYDALLQREDHIARISRLLWEEKTAGAKRILNLVPAGYQKLFKARMNLIADKRLASFSVMMVPSTLKKDPGLIYDRMCYRARRDDDKGVREMLLIAPAQVPYPEKWWKYREAQIREAVGEKRYALAKKLLANHSQVEGSELADATWLQGWLESEFLGHPEEAYKIFYHMHDTVRYPVSKARAAYWAGRAAEQSEDDEAAANWYKTAAAYPTTFYGQLAAFKIHQAAPLRLPAPPIINNGEKNKFAHNELTRAVKLCVEMRQYDLAKKLVSYMVENADNDAEAALASELGASIGNVNLSVHGAKKAMQRRKIVLTDVGYPTPKTPDNLSIERPLALAVARQESEFDPEAQSPSGALGLMQLMAKTAKEIARKNDLRFHRNQLTDASYNMTLGSLYLKRLINSYDGSYVMAIAAYNAGPGNVHNWVRQFGTPGNNIDNAVNWIEKIPFPETRNYVQRVLENVQVYRYLDADGESPRLKLAEDLVR